VGRAVFVAGNGAVTLALSLAFAVTVVLLPASPGLFVVARRGHVAVGWCWHRQRQGGVSRVRVVGHRHRIATGPLQESKPKRLLWLVAPLASSGVSAAMYLRQSGRITCAEDDDGVGSSKLGT
jgi:hypothetical protein